MSLFGGSPKGGNAPQRPNWILWLWVGLFVFFGLQMLTNKPAPDTRTDLDIMQSIKDEAKLLQTTANLEHTSIAQTIKDLQGGQALSVESKIEDGYMADKHISLNEAKKEFASDRTLSNLLNAQQKLSANEDMDQMHILNALVCDVTIQQVESQYENVLNNMKGLTNGQKDAMKIQAQTLVSDTLLKAADQRNDMNRIVQATYRLAPYARFYDSKPLWQQTTQVAPIADYPLTMVSPAQLTVEINALCMKIGQTNLVFGFFPGYKFVNWVVNLTGAVPGFSYWFTALLLAIIARGSVFPISQRQMMWSRQMQQLTPLVNEIKAEYKGKNDAASQQESQKRVMALYQEYGMNPLAGCLPAFIQMPVFLLVYYSMLNYRVQFLHGTFLWINPHTSAAFPTILARSLGEKDYLLCSIYAVTMVVSALLQPVSDPTNVRQQRLMGVGMSGLFGIMMFFWPVPSAFILYWTFTNLLATAQSLRANRLPLPPLVKKNAPNGGVFPSLGGLGGPKGPQGPTTNGKSPNGKVNGQLKSTGAPKVHKPKKKK